LVFCLKIKNTYTPYKHADETDLLRKTQIKTDFKP